MNHYSQNDEQEFILDFFKGRTGNLLDIGAFDGITFSNSRALLETGWTGTLIEPDPFNFVKLTETALPNAKLICAAVGPAPRLSKLNCERYPDRGWASSIHYTTENDRIMHPLKANVETPVIGINHFMSGYGFGFDFINIDAEGVDFEILKAMGNWFFLYCELMCVEPKGPEERVQMIEYFKLCNFKVCHETPENLLVSRS